LAIQEWFIEVTAIGQSRKGGKRMQRLRVTADIENLNYPRILIKNGRRICEKE